MSLSSRLGIGFMRVLAPLPLPLVRGFSKILGRVLHTIAVPRRRVVDRNLALCFPEKSEAERRAIARETFVFVAQSWLDRSWLWHAPEKVVASRLKIVGSESEIREIAEGDVPMILFAPHFYGLDAAATALTMHTARPSATIYTTQRDPMVDAWIREGRTRFGDVAALNRVDGIKPVLSGLRKGGLLYLLPDMDFGRDQTIFVPFYGVQAATVPSLSRFARLGKAKVVPVVAKLTPGGYEIEVKSAWQNFPTDDVEADTALMNERLQGYIDTMPSQYYWVHRRFKTRPDGEPKIY
ncbi:KDO2-lipid IV(A) lauroyltransferase [Variovorax boronicumulans]|uniref:KDO2-lipid IV(A) lauroyltransferase n=1 Tax=Variovorax boronicumulans TaxID=436515 RepID=A0AAW8D4H0_9BURK|nr:MULTISPECIES: lipid A biosynthesis acyltransferase [Variovorax]MDP9895114.1 KDO2-lipid IV(A) lauroyltransferase [Variovorax boronicumulans]MDQ0037267.1 KDO2-lipid IV(A) lauroyltransferase [Variovorax boronicumulans]MDQ0054932.1 KDO2-lipid IV(A) lauroyltransferase [Variovorax boronicumulans]MDQ0069792.1 KDO2-lipid IV(A) lauroyltransferase [Variovorax boronicumulans]MDQ0610312.1 KDO2-lipid IV(A) lauroyltransferase [Variovorax sp. W1I1]